MLNQYRQQMSEKLNSLLKPEHQKVLCVGDSVPNIQKHLQDQGCEFVHVESLNPNWRDVSRDQPHLPLDLPGKHFDLLLVYHGLEQAIDPRNAWCWSCASTYSPKGKFISWLIMLAIFPPLLTYDRRLGLSR